MKVPITHKLAVTDMDSSESEQYLFEVTSVRCRPGFKFVDQECRCNKAKRGVLRSVTYKQSKARELFCFGLYLSVKLACVDCSAELSQWAEEVTRQPHCSSGATPLSTVLRKSLRYFHKAFYLIKLEFYYEISKMFWTFSFQIFFNIQVLTVVLYHGKWFDELIKLLTTLNPRRNGLKIICLRQINRKADFRNKRMRLWRWLFQKWSPVSPRFAVTLL